MNAPRLGPNSKSDQPRLDESTPSESKTFDPRDICPEPTFLPPLATEPVSPPIYTAAVYKCRNTEQAARILAGDEDGYVYSRDRHPNADILAEKCARLHRAECATICGSGMSALAVAALATLASGDHVVVADQLYGRTQKLLTSEIARLGIASTVVETLDLDLVAAACGPSTKWIVVETITNPLTRVNDLPSLAELAHSRGALLLVDNTFASPILCRPLEWGADLVVESLTKIISGHSDVLLGLLLGARRHWERVPFVSSAWGLSASPFDCWLAARGLGTLALRMEKASENAMAAAEFLGHRPEVVAVHYPGLVDHPDHQVAKKLLGGRFGSMLAFTLKGGQAAANAFIAAAQSIPFCPSLGDLSTTLSHPNSTSHRTLAPEIREAQGIFDGTLRLSVGIETAELILAGLDEGLRGANAAKS